MSNTAKSLGQVAYEEYVIAVGGKDRNDKELPLWYDLGRKQQIGWQAAAIGVRAADRSPY